MTAKPVCFCCGNHATLYCDGPVIRLCRTPTEAGRGTCDRPLCRDHAKRVGSTHLLMADRTGRWDSIDHCPECAGAEGSRVTAG